MTPDELKTRHPELLADIDFQCGDGWLPLLDRLCTQLEEVLAHRRQAGTPGGEPLHASQIKEKFGGLRFYVDRNTDCLLDALIEEAEKESFRICEHCGAPGTPVHLGGWCFTLCASCANDRKNRFLGRTGNS